MATDDNLSLLVQWVESAEESTQDARDQSERDRDYYDNKQWTAEEKAVLKKRGQPITTNNRIKRKIDFLTGIEKRQRTDPKAFPRTPVHQQDAEAATDGIRFVCDNNDYDVIRSGVWEEMLIEGAGGCELMVRPRGNQMEIVIKQWHWDRIGWDPHSREPDYSDARYTYGVIWMDADEAKAKWPDAQEAVEHTLSSVSVADTYDDRPRWKSWADNKRKRVKICQMYYKAGDQWHWCIFTKGGKIKGGPVPFVDEFGDSWNPMILTSAYVDRENDRYGVVREMISPQDEINKRRSKMLHQLNMRQTWGDRGAVDDIVHAKTQLARPDGHIEVTPNARFELLRNNDQIAGQAELLQEAKNEIEMLGPNAALQGRLSSEASGRSVIAQQEGGLVELATMLDRLRQWNKRVYEGIWHLIRQYWTEERWVRITDDEQNIKFVGFNRPVTLLDDFKRQLEAQQVPPQQMQAELAQAQMNPMSRQVIGVESVPAQMEMDIIVDDAPDSMAIQAEQFEMLSKMVTAGLPIPPDIIIEASQLRTDVKKRILDKMNGADNPEAQQMQQQAQMLEMAGREAKVRKDAADAMLTETKAAMAGFDVKKTQADILKTGVDMEKTGAEVDLTHAQTVKTLAEVDRPQN